MLIIIFFKMADNFLSKKLAHSLVIFENNLSFNTKNPCLLIKKSYNVKNIGSNIKMKLKYIL